MNIVLRDMMALKSLIVAMISSYYQYRAAFCSQTKKKTRDSGAKSKIAKISR